MLSINDYIKQLTEQQETANAANQARLNEVKGIYDSIIASYAPGGSFGKDVESQLATSKTKAVSSGSQALARSGFANSSMMAQLGNTFEKEVGAPTRLTLENQRQQGIANAQASKAGVIERVNDVGPDNALIASLLQQSSKPTTSVSYSPASWGSIFQQSPSVASGSAPVASSGMVRGQPSVQSEQQTAPSYTSPSMSDEDFQALLNQNTKKNSTMPSRASFNLAKPAVNPYMDMSLEELLNVKLK